MKMFLRILLLSSLFFAASAHANKLLMPGEVIKGHAKVEEDCEKCHKKFDKAAQSTMCSDCHKDVGKDIADKTGYHGRMDAGKECKECHTEHKGRDARIAEFDHDKFDHKLTDFQLKEKHLGEKVKCGSCHKAGVKFRDAPSVCNSCHKKDDKHKGGLGTDCAKCHSEKDWKTTNFDHSKTHFNLLGKHVEVKCDKCHIDGKYKDTAKLCNSCHQKDDKHKGNFGTNCETCHSEKGWKEIIFEHNKKTKYPLFGKHAEAKCVSCHKGKLYKEKLKTNCFSCHQKDDKHKASFGPKCDTCHVEKGWKEILFDHAKLTKYPLLGKHAQAKCVSCHKGDLYKDKLKQNCLSCHLKDDKHKTTFGAKCEDCHVEKEWKEIKFDHAKQTKYPLLGKHVPVKCVSCHKGDLFKDKLQSNCIFCHEKDDKHKGQEGKKCESCHVEESWNKTNFNHQRMSAFPLLGRHSLAACKKCHIVPTFKDAGRECFGCHEKDDTHKRKFGTECQICHSTRAWQTWDFDHNKTMFKLDGPHKKIADRCYSCHQKPMDKKVLQSTACGSCHDRDDRHNGNFGDRCDRCHDGDDWKKVKIGATAR